MKRRLIAVIMVLALLGGFSAYAANVKVANATKSAATQSSDRVVASLEQAIKLALEAYPGTVVKAENEHGLYEIRIRTDKGEVITVKIDPADGSMVSFKRKGLKD
ncbi:MAG: PepSY domain-containing protein [Nitrospirota bacterium]|nr:PepSY domain-containing protein [Nitrospirota bacterium]